jgi:hypothetical protein
MRDQGDDLAVAARAAGDGAGKPRRFEGAGGGARRTEVARLRTVEFQREGEAHRTCQINANVTAG